MLWNSLMHLNCPSFKSLSYNVCGWKLYNWMFDFIKILTQIINKISKFWQNENNLIFAKMVMVLQYIVILMKMTQCYILPLQLSQLTSFFTTPT